MPVGTEIGLGPGHILLDGDPASIPQKGQIITQFWTHAYCGQTAGWIKMILGTDVGIGPGDIVLDGDPSPPQGGGAQQPQFFWPMSIVAKLSSISATAELFFENVISRKK